jgi:hypothetical protein
MTKRVKPVRRKLLVFPIAVAFFSCCVSIKPGYFADDRKAAERAVDQFHARLSDEKYEEIYGQAAEELRRTAQKDELILAMKRTHDQFGGYRSAEQTDAKVIMGAPRQVRLVYNTKYEKRDATEEFIWLVNFDDVKLALYKVSPKMDQPIAK